MSRLFVSRLASVSGRRLGATKIAPVVSIWGDCRSGGGTVVADNYDFRQQQQPRRKYHSGVPSLYQKSICDTDPKESETVEEAGSKAYLLESDRHALVDLFKKYASPEHPRSLDREGLRNAMKAVGESPDDATLTQIFSDADLDGNGVVDLEEFLTTSDKILGGAPAGMVLLVGGPGSGKGVLSKRLVEECGVVHISSGDLLREEVARDTPLGREVKEIMVRGDLVSSAVIVTLMKRKMRRPGNAGKRVLLDGFPRSLQNATDLMELCGQPELALHLKCDDTVLIERILKRKEEAADSGGRDDDNIKTALKRLRNYHKYSHVTLDWLRENRVPVVNLDCDAPPDQVWEQLLAIGRLVRPATRISKDDLTILPGNGR
jgi:adenylate kinase